MASGAAALTGTPGTPAAVDAAVVERMEALGAPIGVDVLPLVTERARLRGLTGRGRTSCGGHAHLLRAADGWLAVHLAREDDRDAVPAWLEADVDPSDPDAVAHTVAGRSAAALRAQGVLLGMPIAVLGEVSAPPEPVAAEGLAGPRRPVGPDGPLVVDCSAMWAGPLCARLLGARGCRVVKVESVHRPDGARTGDPLLFERLHRGHEVRPLDLRTAAGREALRALLLEADVVIEASRPRAFTQLGLDPASLGPAGPAVWVGITGYGRHGEGADRVAFGDDAAVAGGLVARDDHGPVFLADAVADPLTGIAAAAAVLEALASADGRVLLDVAMARVAAWVAGP